MSLKTSTITNVGSKNVAIYNLIAFTLIPDPSGIKKWRVKIMNTLKKKLQLKSTNFMRDLFASFLKNNSASSKRTST